MKLRTLLMVLAALTLFSTAIFAAGVDGKWTAEMQGRDGNTMTQTFTFKSDGEKLTGTITGRMGENPIEDGKIDGDNISFVRSFEMNGETMKMKYTGKVSGDEIKMSVETPRGKREFTAKRSTT